ncbi:hypothetical protein Vafri_15612 [Volvox africanus]|nr:hypothetical protein Vafri_15612 [Volvox africanus]
MRQLLPTGHGALPSPVRANMYLAPTQPLSRPQCSTAVLRSIASSPAHLSHSTQSDDPAHGRNSHVTPATPPMMNAGTDTASAGASTSPSSPAATTPPSPSDPHLQPAAFATPANAGLPPAIAPPSPPSGAAAGALLVLRARVVSARDAIGRTSSSLLGAASHLGAKLNQITGYDTIEKLKRKVDEATQCLVDAREELRDTKAAYEEVVSEQGDVQRQQMALLQRKSSWQAADLERFTDLCRQEHRLELEVAQAKAVYADAVEAVEACHNQVAEAVRERYGAETMWSDKIRQASTWWTAGLMALQMVSFMSVYLIMEPIKAQRLRDHVEDVLRVELASIRESIASLKATLPSPAEDKQVAATVMAVPGNGLAGEGAADGGRAIGGGSAPSELLEQVRQAMLHLQALEEGLSITLAGRQIPALISRGTPVVQSSTSLPISQEARHDGYSGPDAVSLDVLVQEPEGNDIGGQAPGPQAWHRWLGQQQLYRVAATMEARTAVAAFAGAALSVGLLLLLRDR